MAREQSISKEYKNSAGERRAESVSTVARERSISKEYKHSAGERREFVTNSNCKDLLDLLLRVLAMASPCGHCILTYDPVTGKRVHEINCEDRKKLSERRLKMINGLRTWRGGKPWTPNATVTAGSNAKSGASKDPKKADSPHPRVHDADRVKVKVPDTPPPSARDTPDKQEADRNYAAAQTLDLATGVPTGLITVLAPESN